MHACSHALHTSYIRCLMQALQNCASIALPETFQKVPEDVLLAAAELCPEDGRWAQVDACRRCTRCRVPGTVRLPNTSHVVIFVARGVQESLENVTVESMQLESLVVKTLPEICEKVDENEIKLTCSKASSTIQPQPRANLERSEHERRCGVGDASPAEHADNAVATMMHKQDCVLESDAELLNCGSVERQVSGCTNTAPDGQQSGGDVFVAFSHEGGCVRWCAVRGSQQEAVQDRKSLLAARRARRLNQ
jgi:hypothetical protein